MRHGSRQSTARFVRPFVRPAISLALAVFVLLAFAPVSALRVYAAAPQQLPWPVGSSHTITGNTYGCNTHTGTEAYAIDFGDLGGTSYWPIAAVQAGKAHRLVTTDGGNAIWVAHSDGTNAYYGHMSSFSVADGATVRIGTVLGMSGKTGAASGIHLHFSMHKSGSPWGTALLPEPMSGYSDFRHYGYTQDKGCGTFVQRSSAYLSTAPPNGQQVTVARHPNGIRIDLFVMGINGAAYHAAMTDGVTLGSWESLGGTILGAPNASWRGDGSELDVFAIYSNHVVYEDRLVSGAWLGWKPLTGTSGTRAREEVTVARAPDGVRLDLFIRGTDGYAWHGSMLNGSTLGAWELLSFGQVSDTPILGAPAASWAGDGGVLSAFAIGTNHSVYRDEYSVGRIGWAGWQQLTGGSGAAGSEMVGVARGADGVRLDLFVRAGDGKAWHAALVDGSTIGAWGSLASSSLQKILGAPTGTWNWSGTSLDAFAIGGNNSIVYRDRMVNGTWTGWGKLSGTSG